MEPEDEQDDTASVSLGTIEHGDDDLSWERFWAIAQSDALGDVLSVILHDECPDDIRIYLMLKSPMRQVRLVVENKRSLPQVIQSRRHLARSADLRDACAKGDSVEQLRYLSTAERQGIVARDSLRRAGIRPDDGTTAQPELVGNLLRWAIDHRILRAILADVIESFEPNAWLSDLTDDAVVQELVSFDQREALRAVCSSPAAFTLLLPHPLMTGDVLRNLEAAGLDPAAAENSSEEHTPTDVVDLPFVDRPTSNPQAARRHVQGQLEL